MKKIAIVYIWIDLLKILIIYNINFPTSLSSLK